jgi:hypothetical protein
VSPFLLLCTTFEIPLDLKLNYPEIWGLFKALSTSKRDGILNALFVRL